MIAVDTNVLIYAFNSRAPDHSAAAASMKTLVESARWGLPWPVVYEFFRVVTSGAVFEPAPPATALNALDAWIEAPGCRLLAETPADWPAARGLLDASRVSGSRAYDARIAAICMANGVSELWTADRDFGRFSPLRTRNPLVT